MNAPLPFRILCILLSLALSACATSQKENIRNQGALTLISGHYTNDGAEGIYSLSWNPSNNTIAQKALLAKIHKPSFLAVDEDNKRVYSIGAAGPGGNKQDRSAQLYSFSYANSDLSQHNALVGLDHKTLKGVGACHIALNPDKTHVGVANYVSGDISIQKVDPASGKFVGEAFYFKHTGSGPSDRQKSPHAHWISWDNQGEFIYVVDLGNDTVQGYPMQKDGSVGPGFTALRTPAGAGPRHMAFHPTLRRTYVLNELNNTIIATRQNSDGTLSPIQTLPTLPHDFKAHSQAAHIVMSKSGKTVFVSNRGHNSIASFELDRKGKMTLKQHISVEGDWPRFFMLAEAQRKLLVANRKTNEIVSFDLDDNLRLSSTGKRFSISQPVFLYEMSPSK